ncbi:hypothetical protein BCR32DRAFT_248757 [Anaeromyces robustus]|uniref:Uncharacterized protein n=1 Tax=Anaeromyces robustus TaxID=1754192 RepID=A0A1Y1WSX4_9FUNG|nr:hypothetical protein BCR32DRAFT_248757 [Anaeromyces robustus]|eukprot:ORX76398.1 hypothetical protein BCR32DRAFT_248757 [Anaeromyces robustus]
MNVNLIYSITGFFGGLLCCVADILLDLKGKDNKEVEHTQTNWSKMALWRFHWSIYLAIIAVPMYNLGLISLGNQIVERSATLGFIFRALGYLSNVVAFFIHSSICYGPIIYKAINDKKEAHNAINAMLKAVEIPFIISYIGLIFGASGTVAFALIKNYIQLSNFFILLTPLCTFTFGMTLRAIKYDWFYDLPGIIMPSFGMACIGLIGALNILLNKTS